MLSFTRTLTGLDCPQLLFSCLLVNSYHKPHDQVELHKMWCDFALQDRQHGGPTRMLREVSAGDLDRSL